MMAHPQFSFINFEHQSILSHQVLQYKRKCSELEADAELRKPEPLPPTPIAFERPVSIVGIPVSQNPVPTLGCLV